MTNLIFEGAGWADADSSKGSDLGNCRIRTRFKNSEGRLIYLEITQGYKGSGCIDHCFYADRAEDLKNNYSPEISAYEKDWNRTEPSIPIYCKKHILKFVNSKLSCNFKDIEVINEGLFIHDNNEAVCESEV